MSILAVIGGQWGDEGKGKIVDLLSSDVDIVARYQGGANAGHTVYHNDKKAKSIVFQTFISNDSTTANHLIVWFFNYQARRGV